MHNKRGQFFLVAAIVIVILVIGVAATVNTVETGSDESVFYDLADEVGFETKQVLDYGTYNAEDTLLLTEEFLEQYANYIAQEEVLFIYGDRSDLQGLVFTEGPRGDVGISTGGVPGTIQIQYTTGKEATVNRNGNSVVVDISGILYDFELRQGQNFFFVIIKGEDDERFVATG